jgi:PAS domain S-box-containing protein
MIPSTGDAKSKSRTMRIDLIPDAGASVPLGSQPRQTVIPSRPGASGIPMSRTSGQQSYQELFQSVYDSGIITDLRGRIRDVNRRAVEFFGYPVEAFRQMTIFHVICGASEEMLRNLFENLQKERFTLILACCETSSKEQVVCEIAVSQMRLSTPHLCFFVRDVSKRYAAEQMLRTEHAAIQNASEPIVVVDVDNLVDYANPATLRLWDFDEEVDLHSVPIGNLFADPDALLGVLGGLRGETPTWRGELTARRPDGTTFQVSAFASVNRDNDGDILGTTLNFTDRSEARETERLREAVADISRKTAVLAEWFNGFSAGIPEEMRDALREKLQAGVVAIEDVVRAINAAE